MRLITLLAFAVILFSACKKDKYTSAPQITYKSLTANVYSNSTTVASPAIKFSITDSEGDLGINLTDTARIYIKNLLTQQVDSLDFPDLSAISKSKFKADVTASIGRLSGCQTANPPNHIDTMYYEVYVKDFAKNVSNTITTPEPVFQQCP